MSPGRYDKSGQAAKVKPGPEPPPQDPGGRFRGTYGMEYVIWAKGPALGPQ